ncbi:MAG TPA: hypothetical protein VFU81_07170, partial [Thermomicrobiales bacterium]|nr:hypothetical protein [Thermomicrobiales bacterium]
RWHLAKNAGEVLERVLQRHPAALRQAAHAAFLAGATAPDDTPATEEPPAAPDAPAAPPGARIVEPSRQRLAPALRKRLEAAAKPPKQPGLIGRLFGHDRPAPSPPAGPVE